MQFIQKYVDMGFGLIPVTSGREYLQAPVDASLQFFGILNADPAMWGLELLATIEMSVIPALMIAASGVVSYDAYKNPEIWKFLFRQVTIARHLVFDKLPSWITTWIPASILGPATDTKEILSGVPTPTPTKDAVTYAKDGILPGVPTPTPKATEIKMNYLKTTQGAHCKKGAKANTNYTGKLLDGTVFDSNTKNGTTKPFTFTVGAGQVIKCWDYAVQRMAPGDVVSVLCPSETAYGGRAIGPIPANSDLVFKMEVVSC